MRTLIPPEVDMLLVSVSSQNQRKAILSFVPNIGLSTVDYSKLYNVDMFYNDCQNLRDYYRDPYNKLPRPESFKRSYGKCVKQKVDRNTILLSAPATSVHEQQLIVYPMVYDRGLYLDQGICLGGRYDTASCIKYKR